MSKTTSTELVNYDEQLAAEAASMTKSIQAPSSQTISTKGKMFSMPDGRTSPGPMDVIILDFVSVNSFFEGTYDPNNPAAPVCWSINKNLDEMVPSSNAPKPQAETCKDCPKNQWKSAAVGKGKACKNTRRIVIIPPDATAETQPMTLNVSPGAIKAFDAYANNVKLQFNAPPVRVTTEVGFEPSQTYPSLTFTNARLHENLGVAMSLRPLAATMLAREPEAHS